MFASGNRTDGLKLMSEHRIKEGLDLAVWYTRFQKGHGSEGRLPSALKAIEAYGEHAKPFIPQLKTYAEYHDVNRKRGRADDPKNHTNRIKATISKLEKLPDDPGTDLVSIADKLKALGIEYPPKAIVIGEDN
jgi:hypothetical protein